MSGWELSIVGLWVIRNSLVKPRWIIEFQIPSNLLIAESNGCRKLQAKGEGKKCPLLDWTDRHPDCTVFETALMKD